MLVGVSGKIGSGKDTIGKIIQYLVWKSKVEKGELPLAVYSFSDFARETSFGKNQSKVDIKKYADSLKDMICILIGCTRVQLEDLEFKNTELPEEWWYWKLELEGGYNPIVLDYLSTPKEELKVYEGLKLIKPTPRLLLQLLGTECGRDILHPNVWVNALFSEYKESPQNVLGNEGYRLEDVYPNWIITDVRFPNELEAIKKRGGISIRVNRDVREFKEYFNGKKWVAKPMPTDIIHSSETALDNAEFDYTINNDSSIEDLIHTVSLILKKEKII